MVAANDGSDSLVYRSPSETFVEPPTLASVDGELDVTLQFAYFSTMLNGKAVTLRSMNNRSRLPRCASTSGTH